MDTFDSVDNRNEKVCYFPRSYWIVACRKNPEKYKTHDPQYQGVRVVLT